MPIPASARGDKRMNQNMLFGAIALFLIPVGLVVCYHFDELVMGIDPDARPEGTLIYFYSDS